MTIDPTRRIAPAHLRTCAPAPAVVATGTLPRSPGRSPDRGVTRAGRAAAAAASAAAAAWLRDHRHAAAAALKAGGGTPKIAASPSFFLAAAARPAAEQNAMAGHSKWANIQHRKGRQDEKRGKVWTRLIREIVVAARQGGGDLSMNPRLRLAVEKAKGSNMPADTIKKNIDKATGNLEGVHYEEIRYEGYGIGGAAVIVDCMTDNRVRTVAEVRHAFSKYGGNLGTEGSVAFQFKHVGQFVFAPGASEEAVMAAALDAGAEDVINDEGGAIEVLSSPHEFEAVKAGLEQAGLHADLAEVTMRAENTVPLSGDDGVRMQKLIDVIEDLDDVQALFHNAEISE